MYSPSGYFTQDLQCIHISVKFWSTHKGWLMRIHPCCCILQSAMSCLGIYGKTLSHPSTKTQTKIHPQSQNDGMRCRQFLHCAQPPLSKVCKNLTRSCDIGTTLWQAQRKLRCLNDKILLDTYTQHCHHTSRLNLNWFACRHDEGYWKKHCDMWMLQPFTEEWYFLKIEAALFKAFAFVCVMNSQVWRRAGKSRLQQLPS